MQKISKREYTAEFKEQALKRVKDGKSVGGVAKEMELSGLRAENARLKRENDILRRAKAYFARDAL